MSEPLILEIKGNSLDDGPGIRTVVFFKGCPLSCEWCHNPESKKSAPELAYDHAECTLCDACILACPKAALDRSLDGFVDRDRCDVCGECLEVCPSGALSRVGTSMSVEKVVGECLRDRPFFETSGGGVTLSGGEPTLFMDFCSELLASLRREGVNTIVETCGLFDLEEFEEKVLPFTDSVYYDLKVVDEDEHRRLCGVSNSGILSNFEELLAESRAGAFELLPRVPLIPGMTATEENVNRLAEFLKKAGASRVALLSYNPTWLGKARKIGEATPLEGEPGMTSFMKHSEIARCAELLEGIEIVE